MALAEFNFGTLRYPWDDPRLAEFQENLDRVNAIARRAPGFLWMLPEDQMEAAQEDPAGPLADRPLTASTLSVWADATSLWHFVDRTLHARFMARGAEWFEPDDRSHLVIWPVAPDARPTVAEGMDRWRQLQSKGECDTVFGGATLRQLAKGHS